jgi:hypothetical protein
MPLGGRVWRYNNTLDSVGYGWDNVLATRNFYEPVPRGGILVEAAIVSMAVKLRSYGYTAIGNEVKLLGKVSASPIALEVAAYLLENLHQHLPDTYLGLLNAPPLPFTIG